MKFLNKTILTIAWRNIWRNKRRSILTSLAVAFACAVLTFMMALQQGAYVGMINNTVRTHSGHIQIQQNDYLDSPELINAIEQPETVMNLIKNIPEIIGYAPRINAAALISKGERTVGALIYGIDPGKEAVTSSLDEVIVRGSYLSDGNPNNIIIGEMLAKNLDATIGDEIVIFGQGANGAIAATRFVIEGIYRFGIKELDKTTLAAPIDTLAEVFSMSGSVSEIAILLKNDEIRPQVHKRIHELLERNKFNDLNVYGWNELVPGIEQMIELDWNGSKIIYGALVIVIAFGITNTFLMAYMERIHEYGVLLSLGMKPILLAWVSYLESLWLLAVGLISGIAFAVPVTLYFQFTGIDFSIDKEVFLEYGFDPVIFPQLSTYVIGQSCLYVILISGLMAIYPALKSATLKPLTAMRG